jgi:ABC-type nickel/cobalt efflux system permease component RcnA
MSLITSSGRQPYKLRYWLGGLWPFWLFLLLASAAIRCAIDYWPQILLQSVIWQELLHQRLALLLNQVQQDPRHAGLSLLSFSLVYGILHAVGPGHGKVVLSTYLATHPSRLKLSLAMTLAASALQGIMAIVLVTLILMVLHLSSRMLHLGEFWLEKSSYILVALLGLLLCRRASRKLRVIIGELKKSTRVDYHRFAPLRPQADDIQHSVALRYVHLGNPSFAALSASQAEKRHHLAHGGCGHHHVPDDTALQVDAGWRTRAAVVLAMGFRPCSGAVLVLLFAKVIGVYGWGVVSALVMSVGTSMTLLTLSLMVFFGRRLAEKLSRRHTPMASGSVAWAKLSLTGGLLLIAVGVLLYLTTQPMIMSGIGPFSH